MSEIQYTAGKCNIGEAEIKQRSRIGYVGIVLTLMGVIIYTLLITSIEISPLVGVLIFIPAEMSTIGLLQARNKFCAAYGLGKVQNVTSRLGMTSNIESINDQKKDRNQSFKIIAQSVIIATVIMIITVIWGILLSSLL